MNDREKKILKTIILHYIKTGESVGSRTIEKQYDFGISSATIRNTMSDLETMGFIEKTHSSSGRIPTNTGYKIYIEDVLANLDKFELDVNSYPQLKTKQLGHIIKKITNLISKSTKTAVISTEPSVENHNLKKIELIKISEKRAFVVAVTDLDIVKTANINLNNYTTEQTLKSLSEYINELILDRNTNFTIIDLKNVLNSIGYLDEGFDIKNISKLHLSNETSILLHFEDLISGINFMNEKKYLKKILDDITYDERYKPFTVNVLFSTDLGIKEICDLSVVFFVYEYEGERGIVSLFGSSRMDYKKNIEIMSYAIDVLKTALNSTYSMKLLS